MPCVHHRRGHISLFFDSPSSQSTEHGRGQVDGGDFYARWHVVQVETRPSSNDKHSIPVLQAELLNRLAPGAREPGGSNERVVEGALDRLAKAVPHQSRER